MAACSSLPRHGRRGALGWMLGLACASLASLARLWHGSAARLNARGASPLFPSRPRRRFTPTARLAALLGVAVGALCVQQALKNALSLRKDALRALSQRGPMGADADRYFAPGLAPYLRYGARYSAAALMGSDERRARRMVAAMEAREQPGGGEGEVAWALTVGSADYEPRALRAALSAVATHSAVRTVLILANSDYVSEGDAGEGAESLGGTTTTTAAGPVKVDLAALAEGRATPGGRVARAVAQTMLTPALRRCLDVRLLEAGSLACPHEGLEGAATRRRYQGTWMRFHLWGLTRFRRLVYIDLDFLVLDRGFDALFSYEMPQGKALGAARFSSGECYAVESWPLSVWRGRWPCAADGALGSFQSLGFFNAGMLVITPDAATHARLLDHAAATHARSVDAAGRWYCVIDQILLYRWFDWAHDAVDYLSPAFNFWPKAGA